MTQSQQKKATELFYQGVKLKTIAKTLGLRGSKITDLVRARDLRREPLRCWSGDRNPKWKGGRIVDKNGYILIHNPNHPHAKASGHILEHRLVMEYQLGRYLDRHEVVHHINKNKQDNRPENLELYSSNSDHLRAELTGHVPKWTTDCLRRMKEGVARSAVVRRNRSREKLKQNV